MAPHVLEIGPVQSFGASRRTRRTRPMALTEGLTHMLGTTPAAGLSSPAASRRARDAVLFSSATPSPATYPLTRGAPVAPVRRPHPLCTALG